MEKDIKKIIEEIEGRKEKKVGKKGPVDITIKIKENEERKGFGVESEISGNLADIVCYMAQGIGEVLKGLFEEAGLDEDNSRELLAGFMTTLLIANRSKEEEDD